MFNKKGSIEGNNKKIENLVINQPNSSYVGIFAYGFGCSISNVHFKNVTIKGQNFTGVLFGYLQMSALTNLIFESIVGIGEQKIGWSVGLIGRSTVTNIVVISSTMNATTIGTGNDFGIKKYIYFLSKKKMDFV